MLKGGIFDPRNKALMKMFNMIGVGERAGSGVPGIFAVWDEQEWVAPIVEEQYNPDRTILTLSFEKKIAPKDQSDTLDDTLGDALDKRILTMLQNHSDMTQIEIAEAFSVSVPTVKRAISRLSDAGRIVRIGGKRYGHWEIRG